MNQVEKIISSKDSGIHQVVDIYVEAFPEQERREVRQWLAMVDSNPCFSLFRLLDRQRDTQAFISLWRFDGFSYIEHFAVRKDLRGQGLGRVLLRAVMDDYQGAVVLEVENPDQESSDRESASRRICFYRNLGFEVLDADYVQPPYRPSDEPLPMLLMAINNEEIETDCLVATIHKEVYGYNK